MLFEIKHRFSEELLFKIEIDSWKLAVEAAIKAKTDLSFANLCFANLNDNCKIETGETWGEYKTQTVPALLQAAGKKLRAVVEASWDCHSWENCPMASAFNVHKITEIPILYRPRAEQFIKYFDAGMLKKEEILA